MWISIWVSRHLYPSVIIISSISLTTPSYPSVIISSSWIKNISNAFLNAGLDVVQATHLPVDNTTRKLETDNHLMALEDTLPDIARHVAGKSEVEFETAKQDLDGLLQRAVGETGRGVWLRMEWYSCLGRKSG